MRKRGAGEPEEIIFRVFFRDPEILASFLSSVCLGKWNYFGLMLEMICGGDDVFKKFLLSIMLSISKIITSIDKQQQFRIILLWQPIRKL